MQKDEALRTNALTTSDTAMADPTSQPRLIDIELEPLRLYPILRGLFLLIVTALIFVIAAVLLMAGTGIGQGSARSALVPSVAAVTPYVLLGAFVAVYLLAQHRRKHVEERLMRDRLVQHSDEPLEQTLAKALEQARRPLIPLFGKVRQWGIISSLNVLTRSLARSGRKGVTLRLCTSDFARPLRPLAVPIEPLPLDESVPSVAQLGDANRNDFENPCGEGEIHASDADESRTPDEFDFRRRLKRNVMLQGGRWVFVLFLFSWTCFALEALLTWRITWTFVLWTAMLGSFAFGPGGRGAWSVAQQWLIVPGGLIARRSNRRGGWDVHLFNRRTGVLTAYRHTPSHWFISVADTEKNQTAIVTPTEATALLRAWLSPLEPPPPERLQELTG